MTDKLELLPCPFCGAQPAATKITDTSGWLIHCDHRTCPAKPFTEGVTRDDATGRWNTRAP